MKRLIIPIALLCSVTLAVVLAADADSFRNDDANRTRTLDYTVLLLRGKLLQAYRDTYRKYELSKLSELEKRGYEWYWSCSMTESSGMITKSERNRISKAHGDKGLTEWAKGWNIAGSLHEKAIRDYQEAVAEAASLINETMKSPTKPSTATEGD